MRPEFDYSYDDDFSEARGGRMPRAAILPHPDEVKKHRMKGHCPYRSWCEDCLRGAANMDAHPPRGPFLGIVPEVHSDYGFFRDKKGDKVNKVVVLVSRDRGSGGVCAHVVPQKVAGSGWIVKQHDRDLKKFGHRGKIVLKSDNEPAIKDLLGKVGAMREGETLLEHSPVGDSKANGLAERAMQAVEKQTRVLKISTERNLGRRISVRHAGFPWLVMHAADVITKCQTHRDGRTSYERLKGRPYSGELLEFGTVVMHKVSAKVEGGNG